jgi:hypothetical protein
MNAPETVMEIAKVAKLIVVLSESVRDFLNGRRNMRRPPLPAHTVWRISVALDRLPDDQPREPHSSSTSDDLSHTTPAVVYLW